MLPNYFYNNNYTIVQTKDHVMILTEMVHDVRDHPARRRKSTSAAAGPALAGRFDRPLGRRHARRGDDQYSSAQLRSRGSSGRIAARRRS